MTFFPLIFFVQPNNSTALHVAVEQEDLTSLHIVDFLAQNCNDSNVADQDGNTALHLAAISSKTECMRVLLKAGATDSLSLENKDGKTPIDISKDLDDTESVELVRGTTCLIMYMPTFQY